MMKEPMRTCLVTGKKLPKKQLLRFVVQEGSIVFDEKALLSGRGGYVQNIPEIIEKLNSPKVKKKIAYFMKGKNREV